MADLHERTGIEVPPGSTPVGYAKLILDQDLCAVAPWHLSFLGRRAATHKDIDHLREVFPLGHDPGPGLVDQLTFALRYDGLDLGVLAALLTSAQRERLARELEEDLTRSPYGKYSRILWFLIEWLTGDRLKLPDLKNGTYVPVLDGRDYLTSLPVRVRRQRVLDNLLGNAAFCPLVRRTNALAASKAGELAKRAAQIVQGVDPGVLRRAVSFLYTKETRSSYAIEREEPAADRAERFVALLQRIQLLPAPDEATLVALQKDIVDPRFKNDAFRESQVYVGMNLGPLGRQRIEYIAPRPQDVRHLMAGWLDCWKRLEGDPLDPVVRAAVLSFGFVFIHPFDDGNGRLHRLLIHNVLAKGGIAPPGIVLPVSAVMEARRAEYDGCLESFSLPRRPFIEYDEDGDGVLTVKNDTGALYRSFDATRMAEQLHHWLKETIETTLVDELDFLKRFDLARREMKSVVDLPEQKLNLFVRLVRQNAGTLGKAKREKHFAALSDAEISALERVIRERLAPSVPAARKP